MKCDKCFYTDDHDVQCTCPPTTPVEEMQLRDQYAGMALQAVIASGGSWKIKGEMMGNGAKDYAQLAFIIADAMMQERTKREEE